MNRAELPAMIFGGLQTASLIDYPGKVSCVLFFSGCNFKCPYCHNPDLAAGKSAVDTLDEKSIFNFLKERIGLIDGVVLSGGEPTLQNSLLDLCLKIKAMGFSVKLDTNGSRPHVLSHLFENDALDYVAMDIKTDPLDYGILVENRLINSEILSSIRVIMESGVSYEFRTTCVKPFVNPIIMERISCCITGARRYVLQRFHPNNMLSPDFFKGSDPGFSDPEMIKLMEIAASKVYECVIV